MRKRVQDGGVTIQAIAGNHAVFFGFDLDEHARPDCLGFAIHRTDHTENEQYWLPGFKTFKSVVPVPDPKTLYSTRDHPMQTFYWGDYTAKPGHQYTYRFVPRYGKPKNLHDRPGVEGTIDISTNDPSQGTHGIYFNRGVAASQAYLNKFDGPPNKLDPAERDRALKWLSRDLIEALLEFIGQASSDHFALRAAVYEFTEPKVLAAFKKAHEDGADVQIVYHALDEIGTNNAEAIAEAGLPNSILTERTRAKIAHNKFIVFCEKRAGGDLDPVSVWTGSTNMSQGGIYGHSNVGHVVRDPEVARRFLDFWTELHQDPESDALRDWTTANSPFAVDAIGGGPGTDTLFSPRHGGAPLKWYANRFGGVQSSAHITQAFGMGAVFETALENYVGDALHYVSLEKADTHQDQWGKDSKVFIAVGSQGGPNVLARWGKEHLTGFNPRVHYLHTKVLLIDPLSDQPTVITGSANFSPASTSSNDENMLIIPGDLEAADVYFTEFARIFNHFYARYWAHLLNKGGADAEQHGFLNETDDWQAPYFKAGNPKYLQRTLYSSQVSGNVP